MATNWQDRLRPASFRGVPFFIDGSQKTTGRRVANHEFPDRDLPYPEDAGKVGNTYRIEGHLIGDYWENKRLLEEAVEKEGPGELIHPYYGTLLVQVGPVSFDEDNTQGQICNVTFLFYEAGDNRFPKNIDDKQAILEAAKDNALAQAKADFDEKFSIAGLPGFAVDTARASVAAAQEGFDNATSGLAAAADGIADLAFSTRNLVAETDDLLQSPANLSDRLLGSLSLLQDAFSSAEDQLKANRTLFNFGEDDDEVIGTTPSRVRERENKKTFDEFMQRATVITAVESASETDFASLNESATVRRELSDLIQNQSDNTDNDDLYQALRDLDAALVSVLPDVDADLPNIETVEVDITRPSLVLVYDVFQDPRGEQDLIDRNNIRHPGFVVGGTELEVLDVRESS